MGRVQVLPSETFKVRYLAPTGLVERPGAADVTARVQCVAVVVCEMPEAWGFFEVGFGQAGIQPQVGVQAVAFGEAFLVALNFGCAGEAA